MAHKEQIGFYPLNLLGRKYIPIANYSDYGVICFDANITGLENEYPLIWLDHEDGFEQEQPLAKSFIHLFALCEPAVDEWIRSTREENSESI